MPVASVIIPAYNAEGAIRETVTSALSQTLKDIEVIVVDDGSRDSTLDVIRGVADPRIKVFSYPNAGVSVSCNRGFSKSLGEFLAFLDADDIWAPEKLENQLDALKNKPQAAVAYSWTDHIDEKGAFLTGGLHLSPGGNVLPELLERNFLESGSNALIRREAFIDAGMFNPEFKVAQDWELYLRLAKKYEFAPVSKPQVFYRRRKDSNSSNLQVMEKECLTIINNAYSDAPGEVINIKKRSLSRLYKYLFGKELLCGPSLKAFSHLVKSFIYDPVLGLKDILCFLKKKR